jgi:glycosyltransferase involved in cell wall biosynthesis
MLHNSHGSKLIIVSKSRYGGAGRAAFRWATALNLHTVKNEFYDESTAVENIGLLQRRVYALVKLINRICLVATRLTGHTPFGPFSFAIIPTFHEQQLALLAGQNSAILNLHWVNSGFLSRNWLKHIQREFPVIWTMHDTWLLNGLVHYEIPSIKLWLKQSLLYRIFARLDARSKMKIVLEATGFISPTRWIAELLTTRGVDPSRIRVVPNVVPFEVFYPTTDRWPCKEFFEMSKNKTIIGFVSGSDLLDKRKGLDIIIDAYRLLSHSEKDMVQFVIVGRAKDISKVPADFKCKFVSQISNDAIMNRFYNAIDLLIVPSRADNLPQTATEAQSAGCPVLISNIGGCPETILENQSGKLFEATPTSLVLVLRSTLLDSEWLRIARNESFEFSRRAWNTEMLTKHYESAILELSGYGKKNQEHS